MQTLAGLALDAERRHSSGKDAPEAPSRGGQSAIQNLLNTFAVLNVLHFLTLIALGHLDRRRKAAIGPVHRSSSELRSNDFNADQSGSPKSADYTDNIEGADGPIRPSDREAVLSLATTHEQTPLLLGTGRPRLAEDPVERPQVRPQKEKEARRGELFAGLCVVLVVFAWVLFLVTAWLRLRSKAERGGAATVFTY